MVLGFAKVQPHGVTMILREVTQFMLYLFRHWKKQQGQEKHRYEGTQF